MSRISGSSDDATAQDRPVAPEGRAGLRWQVRGACLAAAVAAMLPLVEGLRSAVFVPATSPFMAAATTLGSRSFQAAACLGLAVGLIALVSPRWFCRWVCPTGLCADAASRLGQGLGRRCPRLPRLGQWIALLTLGGACVGYPLLVWLDPLAMFGGLFSVLGPWAGAATAACALGVPLVVLLSLLFPGAWCARTCPLGATQDLLTLVAGAVRFTWRKGRGRAAPKPHWKVARRTALAAAGGAVWALAVQTARSAAPRPVRPPGAAEEAAFAGLCIRCGNCVRVCPTRIIEPDPGRYGLSGLLAPVVRFRDDYCRTDCTRCTAVCPSNALAPLTPEDKASSRMGLARVDMGICLLGDNQECFACRNACPYNAIAMVFSEEEYTLTPQVDPRRCPGCGACEVACPTSPVKAIVVHPR